MPDPSKPYDEIKDHFNFKWDAKHVRGLHRSKDPKYRGVIEIDFDKINSITALKEYVAIVIDELHKGKIAMGMSVKPRKNRIQYDLYLLAGDLKREGKTDKEIAKELFPRDFNDSNAKAKPESAEKKARSYREKYENLVNGGYQDLVYP